MLWESISLAIRPYDDSGGDRLGYKIQYSMDAVSRQYLPRLSQGKRLFFRILLSVALIVLLGVTVHYREHIYNWILPGDAQYTVVALKELLSNLHSGESAGEAIAAFCTEILENASR